MEDQVEKIISLLIKIRKELYKNHNFNKYKEKQGTMLQFAALHYLKNTSLVTASDLAEYLCLSKSSVAQLIKRLHDANLLKRKEDKNDHRVVIVQLTSKGKTELKQLEKKIKMKAEKVFSVLTEKEREEFIRIQEKILNAIKKENME